LEERSPGVCYCELGVHVWELHGTYPIFKNGAGLNVAVMGKSHCVMDEYPALCYAKCSLGEHIMNWERVHFLELSGTAFPIWTVAGLNFELAIRGREALCDETLVFTWHGENGLCQMKVIYSFIFEDAVCQRTRGPTKCKKRRILPTNSQQLPSKNYHCMLLAQIP